MDSSPIGLNTIWSIMAMVVLFLLPIWVTMFLHFYEVQKERSQTLIRQFRPQRSLKRL